MSKIGAHGEAASSYKDAANAHRNGGDVMKLHETLGKMADAHVAFAENTIDHGDKQLASLALKKAANAYTEIGKTQQANMAQQKAKKLEASTHSE